MEEQKRRRERKSAAYWLSKSSILYPICILYVMYVKQVEVYITECSVHISSGTMFFCLCAVPDFVAGLTHSKLLRRWNCK